MPTIETAASATPARPRKLRPAEKVRLGLEVLRTYAGAWRLLHGATLPEALARLRAAGVAVRGEPSAQELAEALRLGFVVQRVLRPLPTEKRCLIRSLVLTRLLARRAIASTLVIGVRPGESFGAHAWVEAAGRPLLPPGGTEFERLVEL